MMELPVAAGLQISVTGRKCSGKALKTDTLETGDLSICRFVSRVFSLTQYFIGSQ